MSDSWQPIFALVAAILIAYAILLWLGTIVWVYRDSRERTRDSWSHTVSPALDVGIAVDAAAEVGTILARRYRDVPLERAVIVAITCGAGYWRGSGENDGIKRQSLLRHH